MNKNNSEDNAVRVSEVNTMTLDEQKKVMLDILAFIDGVCRKNDIKYSVFGGTLIGAIRHKGFIPWDDDIDIILTKKNYDKLKRILDKERGRYKTLKYGDGGERFPFMKVIDTHTCLVEHRQDKFYPNYGVYVDIFCYYPAHDDVRERKKQYQKLKILVSLISRRKLDFKNESLKRNVLCAGKNLISKLLGYKRINELFDKTLNEYNGSKYVIHNWPAYGFGKEFQLSENINEYTDTEFENLTVMIFKNYDAILQTTFGDYMKLPPKSERVSRHNAKAWWREK
ncbi:LicD family protein [Candidatus Saccharibacteria bacterium]|nr:LicD family protein [Candidatus Saccharibacteria bacterium]